MSDLKYEFEELETLSDTELIEKIPEYAQYGNKKELLIFALAADNQLFTRLSCLLMNEKFEQDVIKKVLELKKDDYGTVEYCLSCIDDLDIWLQMHKQVSNHQSYFQSLLKKGFNLDTVFQNKIKPVYLFGLNTSQLILYEKRYLFTSIYTFLFNDMDEFILSNEFNLVDFILGSQTLENIGFEITNEYIAFADRLMQVITRGPSQSLAIRGMKILKRLIINKQVMDLTLVPQRLIINIELGGTDDLFNPDMYKIEGKGIEDLQILQYHYPTLSTIVNRKFNKTFFTLLFDTINRHLSNNDDIQLQLLKFNIESRINLY